MERLHAELSVSVSELKKNPSALLREARGAPVAVLNHNKPSAYLIPARTWEALMELIDDHELAQIVERRRADKDKAVAVTLDEL